MRGKGYLVAPEVDGVANDHHGGVSEQPLAEVVGRRQDGVAIVVLDARRRRIGPPLSAQRLDPRRRAAAGRQQVGARARIPALVAILRNALGPDANNGAEEVPVGGAQSALDLTLERDRLAHPAQRREGDHAAQGHRHRAYRGSPVSVRARGHPCQFSDVDESDRLGSSEARAGLGRDSRSGGRPAAPNAPRSRLGPTDAPAKS